MGGKLHTVVIVSMAAIRLQWDFGDEAVNSTTSQINRQKSARNLVILDFDPSVPRAVLFDPRRDNTHSTTLSECGCHDFTRLKIPKPCMHIYRLAIELGLLQIRTIDTDGRSYLIGDSISHDADNAAKPSITAHVKFSQRSELTQNTSLETRL